MNEYGINALFVGMQESFQKIITEEMEQSFRQITGDINPMHQDDSFAAEVGNGKFSSHVTFGMLTASLYSTLAGVYLPGKYSLIHSLEELKFLKPVFAGDTLTVCGEVSDIDPALKLLHLKLSIKNQHNQFVSKAKMKVLVLK